MQCISYILSLLRALLCDMGVLMGTQWGSFPNCTLFVLLDFKDKTDIRLMIHIAIFPFVVVCLGM